MASFVDLTQDSSDDELAAHVGPDSVAEVSINFLHHQLNYEHIFNYMNPNKRIY
jgi:hypothetical protein